MLNNLVLETELGKLNSDCTLMNFNYNWVLKLLM